MIAHATTAGLRVGLSSEIGIMSWTASGRNAGAGVSFRINLQRISVPRHGTVPERLRQPV
jgi:hypothetical protein